MRSVVRDLGWQRVLLWLAIALLAFRFVHLAADFPAHCRWSDDWARYTDEGWYASGAIHKALLGHWLVPGDFNPVITMPGWPMLLHLLFYFTGVSIVAARATDATFSIVVAGLLALLIARSHPRWGMLAFLLAAASPILFVFSRLALLETPMLACTLAAVLVAPRPEQPLLLRGITSGMLFLAAMLVKSSAIFLLPALFLYIFQRHRIAGTMRPWRPAVLPVLIFLCGIGLYCVVIIIPHLVDFRTLRGQNGMGLQPQSLEKLVRAFYRAFTWVDQILYPFALTAIAAGMTRLQSIQRDPLFSFSIAWGIGAILFSVLHFDAGPRYFVMLVVPVIVLSIILLEHLRSQNGNAYRAALALVGVAVLVNTAYIAKLMFHPAYTMLNACQQIAAEIKASGDPHPLVFGHGAEETTFFTHLEAVDDIGSITPRAKLDLYHPGWAVVWTNDIGLVFRPDVAAAYKDVPVNSWAVMDDALRAQLYLFRIENR